MVKDAISILRGASGDRAVLILAGAHAFCLVHLRGTQVRPDGNMTLLLLESSLETRWQGLQSNLPVPRVGTE